MATALSKNGLLKPPRHDPSLRYSWNRSIFKYPIPGPFATRNHKTAQHLQQTKPFSRFTRSVFRKTKEIDPSTACSHLPASPLSSSSQKFELFGWYMTLLKTRPISTKSATSALIYTAADVSSQTLMGEHLEHYDLIRTLRMAGYGMVILGPSLHYWYNFLARVFPKSDVVSTLKKIVSGQTLYGPTMTAIFFSVNAAFQGENICEIVGRLKRDLLPTMMNGVIYWPFCDFVTFKFVPVHLQPLVVNSFSYLWTIYMTYIASLDKVGTS